MGMMKIPQAPAQATKGHVLHDAGLYDLLAYLFTRGREPQLRERMMHLARLAAGDSVLDVGCGTGTLAIAAKKRVGSAGAVFGIDASPAMVARATRKSARAGIDVTFANAVVEALPFPDAHFDAVLSTLMLHHLPRQVRRQCAAEIRRVLKPRGRLLVIDFGRPQARHGILAHFHRHGHVDFADVRAMLTDAAFVVTEDGPVGFSGLQFVLASAP
jgi:ubiquinone/menaquinone biosynthesis C-methylase UbiE